MKASAYLRLIIKYKVWSPNASRTLPYHARFRYPYTGRELPLQRRVVLQRLAYAQDLNLEDFPREILRIKERIIIPGRVISPEDDYLLQVMTGCLS